MTDPDQLPALPVVAYGAWKREPFQYRACHDFQSLLHDVPVGATNVDRLVKESDALTAITAERARADALQAELAESDALRERLAELLKKTAVALRGEPPPLTSWSWHDVPERAAAAIAAIDVMQRAAAINAARADALEAALRSLVDLKDQNSWEAARALLEKKT